MEKYRSVVLADDDPVMLEWLRFVLSNKGYKVLAEAVNGIEAIALCAQMKPDLILLDINMPEINGLQALEEIHRQSPASKVLIISGEATMKNYEEAIRKGASGFAVKPFNIEKTMEMIEGFFK